MKHKLNYKNSDIILKDDIGKRITLKTTYKCKPILIVESMVSYSFGDFLATKKLGKSIHVKNKKKKK